MNKIRSIYFAFAATMLFSSGLAAAELQPARLRCEYANNPLGIEAKQPWLSWEFSAAPAGSRGLRQTAYQVLVASSEALLAEGRADLWDSGKVASDATIGIEYAGRKLRSNERCFWTVRTWDQDGKVSDWSKPARWTMGLLDASDPPSPGGFGAAGWQAKWIGVPTNAAQASRFFRDWKRKMPAPADPAPMRVPAGPEVQAWIAATKVNSTYQMPKQFDGVKYSQERLEELQPAPLLRREFAVAAPVKRAVVYLCGLGCYQLRVNGRSVDERVLDPAQTDYDVRAFYTTFDVTELLRAGKNAIGVVLGDGWFRQTLTFTHLKQPAAFGRPGLLLQMEIEYADGRVERVVSDGSWKCSIEGPVVKNAVYAGELYDARREMPGWDAPNFDEKNWAAVEVIPPLTPRVQSQMIAPIRVVETVKPVALTNPKPGVWVFDMGAQLTGHARLHTAAPAGTAITLKFAETLNREGLAHQPESLNMGARAVDMYVCRGGEATWETQFTYHSFRYVQVEGLAGKPALDLLEGRFVTQRLLCARACRTPSTSGPIAPRAKNAAGWAIRCTW
ncbi:MAG: family 78 glycoside hydrolase catalytic domain [Verrucomicrobia bacterium]|nr:family 78 glycoside hydrolase catalytic domain [Verrucomicrobiota bacterium]